MVDKVNSTQGLYYSVSSNEPNEQYPHGPPSPIGSKYSLELLSDSKVVFPNVVDHNIMTTRFWIFLKDVNPSNSWKTLFRTESEGGNTHLEVKLWPNINRLQVAIKTTSGVETINTVASLLPRRWYNVAITVINDKNMLNIYVDGIMDGNSLVLKGNRDTTKVESNYTFGRSEELIGVNAYIDKVQIFSRELRTIELAPSYAFMQSTKDPFIVHGCESCTYPEAELVCKSVNSVSIQTRQQTDKSDYAICSLQDLYLNEGFNTARIMGWFTPSHKDADSGTLWLRDRDEHSSAVNKQNSKIALCCRREL